MPTYEFKGRDSSGKAITGKRIANSADSISALLMKDGVIPIQINLITEKSNWLKVLQNWFQYGKVTIEEMGMFARQMHTLCKTGVPITAAIKRLAETARSIRMTEALNGIAEALESGVDLASAMARYPTIFSPMMVSMIRVGQSSGSLDEAFLRLNQYVELEANAIKKVSAAFRYPMLILCMMIMAIFVVNSFVIPTFANIFQNANIPLPFLTVILIYISEFTHDYWMPIVGVLLCSIVWGFYYIRTPAGKLLLDQYCLKIPIIGPILKRIILLRFAQMFSIVINSGVPLLEGLTLASQAINNAYVQQQIKSMETSIQRGKSLTQSAAGITIFTPLEIQMLAVSEETGNLGEMFREIGIFYQREVDYDLKKLVDFMEPALIILLSLLVLLLAFAVYLPIWNMVKLVHA